MKYSKLPPLTREVAVEDGALLARELMLDERLMAEIYEQKQRDIAARRADWWGRRREA